MYVCEGEKREGEREWQWRIGGGLVVGDGGLERSLHEQRHNSGSGSSDSTTTRNIWHSIECSIDCYTES